MNPNTVFWNLVVFVFGFVTVFNMFYSGPAELAVRFISTLATFGLGFIARDELSMMKRRKVALVSSTRFKEIDQKLEVKD